MAAGWKSGGAGGWYPADLVNSEPEASNLTSIRHTYEKAFRLVVRLDLCQLRYEAAATNFMRVQAEEVEVEKLKREREGGEEMRLSIFTSSLNYENFVSAQNLFLEVRASATGQPMVLGKCRGISLVLLRSCQRECSVCFIYVRQFAIGLRDVAEIRN